MTTVQGPVAGRRRLRSALRRAREAVGFTQEQVAASMDWSLSKLIRIESGSVSISTNDLKALLQHYGVDDPAQTKTLIELARVCRSRPWWADYRGSLPSANFEKLMGLEEEASEIRHFQPTTLPGLLQIEDYARSVLRDSLPMLTHSEVEDRVAVRLARQRALFEQPTPPLTYVVIDEAVLRRMAPDPQTMRLQLSHLTTLTELPYLTIEVVPFAAGAYPLSGPFVILSFPDVEDSDVVYLESVLTERLLESPHEVQPYRSAFDGLRGKALNSAESAELIKRVADEFY